MADQDPNIARLQAADPAAGAPDPQIDDIRARVLAEPNVVPLHRRRRVAVTVGAVAAGVALLAGTAVASAAIGRATAPQPETVTAASAPVAENSLPVIGAAPNSPQMPSVGVVSGGGAASTPLGAPTSTRSSGRMAALRSA